MSRIRDSASYGRAGEAGTASLVGAPEATP
jgi:hypothetical protein